MHSLKQDRHAKFQNKHILFIKMSQIKVNFRNSNMFFCPRLHSIDQTQFLYTYAPYFTWLLSNVYDDGDLERENKNVVLQLFFRLIQRLAWVARILITDPLFCLTYFYLFFIVCPCFYVIKGHYWFEPIRFSDIISIMISDFEKCQ